MTSKTDRLAQCQIDHGLRLLPAPVVVVRKRANLAEHAIWNGGLFEADQLERFEEALLRADRAELPAHSRERIERAADSDVEARARNAAPMKSG
jgi:hypothetical protein